MSSSEEVLGCCEDFIRRPIWPWQHPSGQRGVHYTVTPILGHMQKIYHSRNISIFFCWGHVLHVKIEVTFWFSPSPEKDVYHCSIHLLKHILFYLSRLCGGFPDDSQGLSECCRTLLLKKKIWDHLRKKNRLRSEKCAWCGYMSHHGGNPPKSHLIKSS